MGGNTPWEQMRRCVLKLDGTVNYYLDPNDSTKKADGTSAILTGADGYVMVEIPKFYYRNFTDGDVKTWKVRTQPYPGYQIHPAFIKDGVEVDYRYYGAYDACFWDATDNTYKSGTNRDDASSIIATGADRLASVSGVYPIVGVTRNECRLMAANNGPGWRQLDFWLVQAVQMLFVVEYGSFRSQSLLGAGNVSVTAGYPTSSTNQTNSPHSIAGRTNFLGNESTSISPNVFLRPLDIYDWYFPKRGNNTGNFCTVSQDNTTSKSPAGGIPIKMDVTGNDPHILSYGSATWNIYPATNGQTWTVSVYVKANVPTTGQLFIFGANSSGVSFVGGSWVGITAKTINITTEWTRVEHQITFNNADVAFIQMRLDGPNSNGAGQTLWWDGLQVELASSASSFNPIVEKSTFRDTAFMSYRGIENFYGNAWNWVDGMNVNIGSAGTVYVSNTGAHFADNTTTNYTLLTSSVSTGSGFIRNLLDLQGAFLPSSVSGASSTSFITDQLFGSTSTNRVAPFGGSAGNAAIAGAFCWALDPVSSARGRNISARLSF